MKTFRSLFIFSIFTAAVMSSCVGPGYPGGAALSSVGASYGSYAALPRGYVGSSYLYGDRYYSGGRYESGRFYDQGRSYNDRYYHDGRYYYGGRYQQYAGRLQNARYSNVRVNNVRVPSPRWPAQQSTLYIRR